MTSALKVVSRFYGQEIHDRLRSDNVVLLKHYLTGQQRLNEIAESIRYASHIQQALFASEYSLQTIVPESFLFSLPKEQLTGDFTWATRCGNKVIVAVADCTGHGIPGAMMSILGLSFLNQVVLEERCYEPSFILRRLDERMRVSFENQAGDAKAYDGMDIGVCCIDYSTQTVSYAGAMRPLWLHDGQELKEIIGSRYPIGGMRLENSRMFPSAEMAFTSGSTIYLFTDGYSDQFGGGDDKKMNRARLRKLIQMLSHEPLQKQKEQLLEFFLYWKGTRTQTDDVTFAGIRL
jgi:serine phosphatase RsbU (regulator of sigma subunit)